MPAPESQFFESGPPRAKDSEGLQASVTPAEVAGKRSDKSDLYSSLSSTFGLLLCSIVAGWPFNARNDPNVDDREKSNLISQIHQRFYEKSPINLIKDLSLLPFKLF
jgi:hypothetical protein